MAHLDNPVSTPEIKLIFKNATKLASEYEHEFVTAEHLLWALCQNEEFSSFMININYDIDGLMEEVLLYIDDMENPALILSGEITAPRLSPTVSRIHDRAIASVLYAQRNQMFPIDVFLSMFPETNTHATYFINKHGIDPGHIIEEYKRHFSQTHESTQKKMTPNKASNVLEKYCTNLNKLAEKKKIDPLIGRDDELHEIAKTLSRKKKNNVIMVGDSGVGKTAIAEGLALRITEDQVPSTLKNHTVYDVDIGGLVAGSRYRGDFEEKLKELLEAAVQIPKTILFIDEAHMMNGAGGGGQQGGTDFANMIKPALAKGDLKVIASTTWEEYRKHFEKDSALMRRFNKIIVEEPSADETYKIIMGLKPSYQGFHRMKIKKEAVRLAVDLSIKYITDKKLPDKALDVIDSACARMKIKFDIRPDKEEIIGTSHIYEEISKLARVSVDQLHTDGNVEVDTLEKIQKRIKDKVFGQDHAIDQIIDRCYIARAGLKNIEKPIASYLFIGPTGVGKTETAKQFAEQMSMALIRYDMSEYQEKHSIARLIGAPPGYVGHDSGSEVGGGLLISEVEKNPRCILLLDEVEKAHPDVMNILLQAMDNGFITSATGKKANLRNAILIMTSNLGATLNEKNSIGYGDNFEQDDKSIEEVNKFFAPEFRNRLDGIIKFDKLSKINMRYIVLKFIKNINSMMNTSNLKIILSEEAMDSVINKGFNPKMGARPLERIINEKIKLPLSKLMLKNDIPQGEKIYIELLDGEFHFVYNVSTKEEIVTSDV